LPDGAQADAPVEEPVTPGASPTSEPEQPDGDAEAARAANDDPLGIDADLTAVAAPSADATADVDPPMAATVDAVSADAVTADVTIDGYDSVGLDSQPDTSLYSDDTLSTDTFAAVPDDSYAAPAGDVSFDVPAESSESYDV
jgi:hypothetical protein